ncbi:MAG: DoxX family protein [Myxococcota bacterium]
MTAKTIGYWISTGLISLMMLGSGMGYLSGGMNEAMVDHLGYPAHFVMLLGAWKLLVAPALLVPGLGKLKELAYAGLFFTFTGAAWAHLSVGDGVGEIAAPLVALALAMTSFALHREVRFGESASFGTLTAATAQ